MQENKIEYSDLLTDKRIQKIFSISADEILGDTASFDLYYRGTMWFFAEAVEHGLDKRTPAIKKTGELILKSYQVDTGGFTLHWKPRAAVSCRTGDMIRYLIMAGFNDSRVKNGIQWIVDNQRHDGGWLHCPLTVYKDFLLLSLFNRSGKYLHREKDSAVKSCFYGTYACLNALILYPDKSESIQESILRGCEFILNHRIFKTTDNNPIQPRFGWNKNFSLLGYPVLSQFDILYGLLTAAKAGLINDSRTGEAFNLLMSKQNLDGTWNLEIAATGMLFGNNKRAPVGKPNKWVTLNAVRLLQYVS